MGVRMNARLPSNGDTGMESRRTVAVTGRPTYASPTEMPIGGSLTAMPERLEAVDHGLMKAEPVGEEIVAGRSRVGVHVSVLSLAAVVVSGAAVMIYEFIAVRVLQRYFGGGWTSGPRRSRW